MTGQVYRRNYRVFLVLLSLFIIYESPATAIGQSLESGDGSWRAVVSADSLAVHSQMSSSSRIVKYLNRGDTVTIELEIVATDTTWCSVIEPGHKRRSGYVRGEGLDKEGPLPITQWRAKPEIITPDRPVKTGPAQDRALKDAIEEGVAKALVERLDRLLPANPPNQPPSAIDHSKETAHHHHSYCFEDRTFVVFFPALGLPRKPFHPAPPVTTRGPHVRISNPFVRR